MIKKGFVLNIITCVIILCLLTGCAMEDGIKALLTQQSTEEMTTEQYEASEPATMYATQENTHATQENTHATQENTHALDEEPETAEAETEEPAVPQIDTQNCYAYMLLDDSEKQLYAEIHTILQKRASEMVLSSTNLEAIDKAFQCVMMDHPEIFYVGGYTYTKYTVGDTIKKIAFSGTYTMNAEQIKTMQFEIENYVSRCLAGMDDTLDAYGKVKYVYDYLITHTEYNLEAKENQNICSVCVYGESVCQGYAKTMQYILNQIGIPTTLVVGKVKDKGEGHAWNLVKIDDAYYYVDATWGDAYYQLDADSKKVDSQIPAINYDYLCVTTKQITTTHEIESVVSMPDCTETKDNYYVRQGTYFEFCDIEKVQMLFQQAYQEENPYVTFKCANKQVYDAMMEELIDKQTVFNMLRENVDSIAYTNNKNQLTISFWL